MTTATRSRVGDNPFRSKGDVDAAFFCDREEVQQELSTALRSMKSVALSASRRYGKSWVMRLTLAQLKRQGFLTAYLDLGYVHSPLQWIEWYLSAVLSAVVSSPAELFQIFGKYMPSLGVDSVDARPDGYRVRLRGQFTELEYQRIAQLAYDLPGRIAKDTKRRFVICLDEFPEIVTFLGKKDLVRWRRQLREAKTVSYLLATARPVLNAQLFENEKAPLRGLVKSIHLGKIPQEKWEEFILARFKRTGYRIERPTVAALLKTVECYSYYTQMACWHLWNGHKDTRRIELEDLAGLKDWILEHEDHYYEQIWRGLTKPRQSFIAALASEPSRQVFSADFRISHRLPAASTLQAALKYLEEDGLVERAEGAISVTDPFFKEWLRKNVL